MNPRDVALSKGAPAVDPKRAVRDPFGRIVAHWSGVLVDHSSARSGSAPIQIQPSTPRK